MTALADDFDAICLKLGIGPEPFGNLAGSGGPGTDILVPGAIDGCRMAASRGENPLANLIDAVALNAGLGPYDRQYLERGQKLRHELILAGERLVRRHGLTEINKRASVAARAGYQRNHPAQGLPADLNGFLSALGVQGGSMPETVFFAWQSDHQNNVNRSFIEGALKKAIQVVNATGGVLLDPAPDRDTKGAQGSPNIADTILAKIRG